MKHKRNDEMKPPVCIIPECGREVKHKESELCGRCYAWMQYWTDKSPTRRMKRLKQVEFWETRMNSVWKR